MASSQSFLMIHLRMSLSPEPAPPVKRGEPLKTMASREPCLCSAGHHRFSLVPHVLQEQQRAVVHARQSGAKATAETAFVVLLLDLLLLFLPVHAEGWIGEEVVVGLAGELVLGKAVAVPDVVAGTVVVHLLHLHVGRRGGKSAFVVVLPIDEEPRRAMVTRADSSAPPPACRRCRRRGRVACGRCQAVVSSLSSSMNRMFTIN